ncbi:organic cation transporter protein-like [Athalia rosae]|uniref:organic cation transporter protein-like n=1 Tax=Athalia rosae TaxID=37344 RepID=UPI0020341F18|nr:organic cation transporter protein-like [Athalia rosae]
MGYDDVTVAIGEFGRYQKRIYFLLSIPAMSAALHSMAGVFLSAQPSFRCLLPEENLENATFELPSNLTGYPPDIWSNGTKELSSCESYVVRSKVQNNSDADTEFQAQSIFVEKCNSFVYDKSIFTLTTTSEFNLVCDRAWLRAMADSIFMVGMMIGSIIFGDLADRYGRKQIICYCVTAQAAGGLLAALAPELYSFMIFRAIIGSTENGLILVAFVAAIELVIPERRLMTGTGLQLFFTLGYASVALLAYFIRNWRFLQVVFVIPSVGMLAYWWVMPESVRWMLSNGRVEEAKAVLLKASSENGVELSRETLDGMLNENSSTSKKAESETTSIYHLFKYPTLRRKTLLLCAIWFIITSEYYGLSWDTSSTGGNIYVKFVLAALVELPGHALPYFTLDKWGRKIVLSGCMCLSGFVLLSTQFVPNDMTWLTILLTMMGKFAITAAFDVIFIFTAEQYPTVIRNTGVGACATWGRIGGIVAPSILYSSVVWRSLPLVIFGTGSVIASVLTLFLPETLNQKLPDTIEEGERRGRSLRAEHHVINLTKSDEAMRLQSDEKTKLQSIS